jgi:hypothetical protein
MPLTGSSSGFVIFITFILSIFFGALELVNTEVFKVLLNSTKETPSPARRMSAAVKEATRDVGQQ